MSRYLFNLMEILSRFLIAAAFSVLWSLSVGAQDASESAAPDSDPPKLALNEINNAVAFLAGLDAPHAGAEDLFATRSFSYHQGQIDKEWGEYTSRTLHPMSDWASREVAPWSKQGGVVRYMFSGPDILHAFHFFPKADTFVLCGLEPVGVSPDISKITTGTAGRALGEVRNALGELINFSFFRTKDMKDDLQFATFRGTTPLMMVFLARSGQYIKGIEFFDLQKDGTLTSQGVVSKGANAVRIDFSPLRVQKTKSLYYFSTDLSDGGFTKNGFDVWLSGQAKGDAYLKAASFLMHESYFSDIRNHLLENSIQIVEDDSGIPYKYFDKEKWDIQLYGSYTGPIDLFSQHYQSDLRAAYRADRSPIEFGTGYKWRKGESNLMRYVVKGAVKEELPKTEPAVVNTPAAEPAATTTETPDSEEAAPAPKEEDAPAPVEGDAAN